MDNVFEFVKSRVDIVTVASRYGISINSKGFCCCPFHSEKTPSMSISRNKQIFCCFGCGKAGDVITFVSLLQNIKPFEAVKEINEIMQLGIQLDNKKEKPNYFKINQYKINQQKIEAFKKKELKLFIIYKNYLCLLKEWGRIKDPTNELYIESLKNLDYIEYTIESVFIDGTNKEKISFMKENESEVRKIESRIREFRKTPK